MPTYEDRCPEGHEFESFVQKMSDAKSELPCPTCGVTAARRMSAGSGFLFKGSGFYITDYGKDGKKAERAAAEKSDKSAAAATATPATAATGATGSTAAPTTAPAAAPAAKAESKPSKPAPGSEK
jgi:putative FmdB family regulatory protein